jgi:tetratricopeptide (TPR) repeat protein
MTQTEDGKYRKQDDDPPGRLVKEERRRRRPSMGGLAYGEIEERADAALPGFRPIADLVLVEDESGTAAGEALGDLGVGLLLVRQKNARLRALLEEASALISNGQPRPALDLVEKALAIDGDSVEVWALRGRCLADLGFHEAALRVLRHARDRVTEPDLRLLVFKLEAACERVLTTALETRLEELIQAQDLDGALELVNEGLRQQPSNIVFLHHLANLQWLRGEEDGARKTLEEARRHVGRRSIDLIAELERKIELGPHRGAVEGARAALRKGDGAGALRHLAACAGALTGNEHYEGLRAYAERGRAGSGLALGRRATGPGAPARQQTLRWLLAEELRDSDEALGARDWPRALEALERAAEIDSECGAVCYRHARALVLKYRQALDCKRRVQIDKAREDLRAAEALAERAPVDPDYQEPAEALIQSIRDLRQRLE